MEVNPYFYWFFFPHFNSTLTEQHNQMLWNGKRCMGEQANGKPNDLYESEMKWKIKMKKKKKNHINSNDCYSWVCVWFDFSSPDRVFNILFLFRSVHSPLWLLYGFDWYYRYTGIETISDNNLKAKEKWRLESHYKDLWIMVLHIIHIRNTYQRKQKLNLNGIEFNINMGSILTEPRVSTRANAILFHWLIDLLCTQ